MVPPQWRGLWRLSGGMGGRHVVAKKEKKRYQWLAGMGKRKRRHENELQYQKIVKMKKNSRQAWQGVVAASNLPL